MQRQKVILQGGGGHAKVVIDCLQAQGKEVVAVFDKKNNGPLFGIPRYAQYDQDVHKDASVLIAIGDNRIRKELVREVRHAFDNAIHPSSIISSFARIGEGCMILHRTVIQAGTTLGNHVILNTGSQIDHDGSIGDFVHIAPRAVLCGHVKVGEGTLIGAGAVVLPGIKIGKWVTVGAGAVVTKDIADYSIVAGVPGKVIGLNAG